MGSPALTPKTLQQRIHDSDTAKLRNRPAQTRQRAGTRCIAGARQPRSCRHHKQAPSPSPKQSTAGVNSGYPRLEVGAVGVAPLAAVAVDNSSRLSSRLWAAEAALTCPGNRHVLKRIHHLPGSKNDTGLLGWSFKTDDGRIKATTSSDRVHARVFPARAG